MYRYYETYTGARATPDLVGREKTIAQINQAIEDRSQSYIIYISGQGGIGKTRLVQHILAETTKKIDCLVAQQPIDLYHFNTYTIEGLMNAIQQTLDPGKQFKQYLAEHATELMVGDIESFVNQRQKITKGLLSDLERISKKKRVVITFDTAEALFYQEDKVAQRLGITEQWPTTLHWLLNDFFPYLSNFVIIVSGRPGPGAQGQQFNQDLAQIQSTQFLPVSLKGLLEDEALAYIQAVIESATGPGGSEEDVVAAETIQNLTDEMRRVIFHCLCDEDESSNEPRRIRPILLALALDQVVTAGELLEELGGSLDWARQLTSVQRRETQNRLTKNLVQNLHEDPRLADDVLLIMGFLTRGASPELLVYILKEASADIEIALAKLKDLSFIKLRQGDDRLFLHDEMYEILQKSGTLEPRRRRIFDAIEFYYNDRIKNLEEESDKLIIPLADSQSEMIPNPDRLSEVQEELREANVEKLHYELRRDPKKGFEFFFKSDNAQAYFRKDIGLGTELRVELQRFLFERDTSGQVEKIEGLLRTKVVADRANRLIKWSWAVGRIDQALGLVGRLKGDARDLIEPGGAIALAELNSWHGYLLGYKADPQAEQLLHTAIQKLESLPKSERDLCWAGILARCYNSLGYVYRTQGRIQDAITNYKRAIPIWRLKGFNAEQPDTLNNIAFALALIGDYDDAVRYGRDGLRFGEKQGNLRSQIGLSLNTLAHIEIRRGHLDRGLRWATRARLVFNQLNDSRGLGLALTAMAEAERRISKTITHHQIGDSAVLLTSAMTHAAEAERIFEEIKEPARQVEALIEVGCAYRDWALLQQEMPEALADTEQASQSYTVLELIQHGRTAFQKAAGIAKNLAIRYLYLDVLLNLVALTIYTDPEANLSQLEALELSRIEAIILDHYSSVENTTDLFKLETPKDWFLVNLGYLEFLRGEIAFRHFKKSNSQDFDALRIAIQHFSLSLEFDFLYSEKPFREMQRGLNRMYNYLKGFNEKEMMIAYETVGQVEKKYEIKQSQVRRFFDDHFGDMVKVFDLLGFE